MRKVDVIKKIHNGEIKIWSSKDYYQNRGRYGYTGHLEELPKDTTESSTIIDKPIVVGPQIKQFPKLLVCLDNGHASTTPGKKSSYLCSGVLPALELYEYEFNRKVAKVLKAKLEKAGVHVYMVCPELDKDISLTTRYTRANNYAASHSGMRSILISIHANAHGTGSTWTNAKGWCAYTTKGQNNSDKLAECLYETAEEIFVPKGKTIRTDFSDGDKDWESNFTIIYGANMPAVLTENFFYTNIDDCKYIMSDEGVEDVAEAHYRAILNFAERYYNM